MLNCVLHSSLLLIGGAVDLFASDYALVARLFYKLALEVRVGGLSPSPVATCALLASKLTSVCVCVS